jgi:hypothetical protein
VTAIDQQQLAGTEQLRLWSVTSLLKIALGTSYGLVNWNCEQTAIASIVKRATVDAMLRDSGQEQAVAWLVEERWNLIERARVRGTNVHKWAEAVALGVEPPELAAHEKPYAEQLARWMLKHRPEFLMAEAPVYNLTDAYAGTCDGVMLLDGKRLIFDYKTTEHGPNAVGRGGRPKSRPPFPEAALQLVAYAKAQEVGVIAEQRYDGRQQRYYLYDASVEHAAMPAVDGALAIVISPHDCYAVAVDIGPETHTAWRHVLEVARWQDETSRHVFGGVLDNVGSAS